MRRDVILKEGTETILLKLWGDFSSLVDEDVDVGDEIVASHVEVKEFNGHKSLNSTPLTKVRFLKVGLPHVCFLHYFNVLPIAYHC